MRHRKREPDIGETMTVYVVHELTNASLRDNLAPAMKFGELRYINRYYIHGDELIADPHINDWSIPPGYRANMERVASVFDPNHDYLLIAGDHLQLLAMTALLASWFDSFLVLRYDRRISEYIPVRLHSGLAPGSPRVVRSHYIGENEHDQNRNPLEGGAKDVQTLALELPLARRDPRRQDPE